MNTCKFMLRKMHVKQAKLHTHHHLHRTGRLRRPVAPSRACRAAKRPPADEFGWLSRDAANFTGLVLSCIETKSCK